jgi:hypothetical protein
MGKKAFCGSTAQNKGKKLGSYQRVPIGFSQKWELISKRRAVLQSLVA